MRSHRTTRSHGSIFFFDSSKIGEATSKPYSINWTAVEGAHTLSAKAIDSKGKESDPAIVVVNVNPSGTRVKITAPVAGSTFTTPATIPITADASDSLGTVVNVEFYNGTTRLGQDTAAPYSFNWNNVAAGKYALQAKVTTSLGKTALSQPVNVIVNASTTSFDITDNGGIITAQYPNTTKPTEDVPSLIDNNKATKYYRSGRTALWVQYKSTVPAIVVKYTISSANDVPARDPKDWTLQGSNNGTTWTTLDTRSGETFASRMLTKTYTANNTNAYLYYRLNITANNGETGTQFSEWELYERRIQTITLDSIGTKTYGDDEVELTAQSDVLLPVTIEVVSGPATYADGTLSITGAGAVTVKASQTGNDNYFPASVEETFIINKAAQSIVFDSIGTKVYGDTPFALNASVESGLPVVFNILSGPATLDNNTLTITGTGDVTIKALQAGNDNYTADSVLQSFTVIKASQHIVFASVGDKTYGKDSIVRLNATTASGLPVSFIATGPVVLNGDSLRITGAGNVTVTALQNGNENYEADTVQQTFIVKKAPQVVTFPTVAPKLKIETATLNATASTGLPVTYTVVSGGATVVNNNQLKFTTEGLVVVKAVQAGNNNYDTASAEQTILVLGLGSLKEGVDIKIYPNPTPGPLKITLQHKKDRNYSFILFDKTGRQVATANILQGQTTTEVNFNLSGLRNDLYFLNVTDGIDKTVRIIVKY
ncbi:MAG: T9SS type A sorting domain-containing protein [Filimonas sp.]|nr:T9SS type A sorting domain-containing protein [Filimonas sp.]